MQTVQQSEVTRQAVEERQYITFKIARSKYGIDVMKVREVLYLISITEIPNKLSYMKGVIDLRGEVVPVIDARIKFNLSEQDYDDDTVIIIIEYEDVLVGLVVDSVSDVIRISSLDIKESNQFSSETDIENDYIRGIARFEEELIIILDISRILSKEEMEMIKTK